MGRRLIDLTGQRFGRLAVISLDHKTKKKSYWLCECDCGTQKVVASTDMKSGASASCGCLASEITSRRIKTMKGPTGLQFRVKDVTGQRFGRWTALSYEGRVDGRVKWLCRCDCGTERLVESSSLRDGGTLSCGCLKLDGWIERRTTHGESKSAEYGVWQNMQRRCDDPTNKAFPNYGGRGIKVCDRWRSFEAFLEDMGPRPSPDYSINRKNNDLHYSCGNCEQCAKEGWEANCEWATAEVQSQNKRTSRILTIKGRSQCLSAWAKETGVPRSRIHARLKAGWSDERSVFGSRKKGSLLS